jgi:hypothetical protein
MTINSRLIWIGGIVAVVAIALVITATSLVSAGGDSEDPITGEALDRASEAALAHTGGGTVTDTEVGDEESYYEVEVTLDDGSQVDVQLDEDFNVVGDEAEGAGEDDEGADDND